MTTRTLRPLLCALHHTCLIERRLTRHWLTVQAMIRLRLALPREFHEKSEVLLIFIHPPPGGVG